jgi:hypothetical protein
LKSLKSNKAAFLTGHDPDNFIKQERKKRNWMPHSVGLVVLSPRGDQVALVLPQKAVGRGADNVRVPPQLKLEELDTVRKVGAVLIRQLLQTPPSQTKLVFLGSGRGNIYRNKDTVVQYGKWIHFMGLQLTQTGRGLFRNDSELFAVAHWCSARQLLAMDTYAMSDRKYLLTLQALLAFSTHGANGQLIARAGQKLKQVA